MTSSRRPKQIKAVAEAEEVAVVAAHVEEADEVQVAEVVDQWVAEDDLVAVEADEMIVSDILSFL